MTKEKNNNQEGINHNYDPYEELANAIVIQACEDYRKAYACYLRRSDTVKKPDPLLADLESFFRSAWYKQLTEVDGELLMERLREEVKKQMKNSR